MFQVVAISERVGVYSLSSTKKKVFISFNYDDDKDYRNLLSALNANTGSEIEFEDYTPSEINSSDVGRIKGVLTTKIKDSDYSLVVVGKGANSYHPDRSKIGTRNWQWWEIEKSKEEGKTFIAVKIERSDASPEPLKNVGTKWAHSFNVDAILKAINEA